MDGLIFFGIMSDFRRVIIQAHMFDLRAAFSTHNKTSRQKMVARTLQNRVRFPGQQGFVYFRFAMQQDGIDANLFSHIEHDDIVLNQFLNRTDRFFAVADHRRFRHGDE